MGRDIVVLGRELAVRVLHREYEGDVLPTGHHCNRHSPSRSDFTEAPGIHTVAENNPDASISARLSGSVSGVGNSVPSGTPSPISSYSRWISPKNGRRPRAPRAARSRTRGARLVAKVGGQPVPHVRINPVPGGGRVDQPERFRLTPLHPLLEAGVDDGHAGKFREVLRGLGREFGTRLHARDPVPAPRERQRRPCRCPGRSRDSSRPP
jgi:hypothetical protein